MIKQSKQQTELNNKHVLNPQIGDKWVGTFADYCYVKNVTDTEVEVCFFRIVDESETKLIWDINRTRVFSKGEFYRHLCILSTPWCDVVPAVDDYKLVL